LSEGGAGDVARRQLGDVQLDADERVEVHVAIVCPVGVGKTSLAHALGWLACHHGHTVLALTADKMLKQLKHDHLSTGRQG